MLHKTFSFFLTSSLVILGNTAFVVTERSGWRRVLGASKPRLSAKGAHPYRKRACLEALRLATTKLTQRGTGYPSWGHPTQLGISRVQLGDRRNDGESNRNSGDGTGQMAQPWMFMMMMVFVLKYHKPFLLIGVHGQSTCYSDPFSALYIHTVNKLSYLIPHSDVDACVWLKLSSMQESWRSSCELRFAVDK